MGISFEHETDMARQESSPYFSDGLPDLAAMDADLLADLREKSTPWTLSPHTETTYANAEIADAVRPVYSLEELQKLAGLLRETGALHVPIGIGTVHYDGVDHEVPFVAATELGTSHGDMSSMIYLRDHFQVARIYMGAQFGRELLLSGLDLLSTPAQLDCFENVIGLGRESGQGDWPKISLLLNDLEGNHPNNWRNIQDTLQMAAHDTLAALEQGLLNVSDLSDRHKQMLGMLVPFLDAVGYPNYPNSGSWEEIATVRTSVMGIETALLHQIKTLAEQDSYGQYNFLKSGYAHFASNSSVSFSDKLDGMIDAGLKELGRRLPFESPEYDKESVEYREADATLAYLLLYDVPKLLANYYIPIGPTLDAQPKAAEDIEAMILDQLCRLMDPATGGMRRYEGDSYLRTNFLTNEKQVAVNGIKQLVKQEANGGEIDLSKKQRMRGKLLADGPEAAWAHPVAQVSAWAGRRANECLREGAVWGAEKYINISTQFLNEALRMVTGEGQVQIALQPDSGCGVQAVSAFRMPECITSCEDRQGIVRFASPHTPLNWGTAQLHEAISQLNAALEKRPPSYLGRTFAVHTPSAA